MWSRFLFQIIIKRTFLLCWALSALMAVLGHVSAIRAPPPVEVNKCCRVGETFDRNSQLCAIGATDDHWWPPIYLIAKNSYFARQGEAPRFLRAHENTRPKCDQPDLVSEGFALFSNGSLFLGERNLFIDIENFCIDKDVALVCLAHHKTADSLRTSLQLTKVKKCCTPTSYLERSRSCIPLSSGVPQKLFQTKNASHIDLIFGFPRCASTTNNYVVADQFREPNLNLDDGTYTLENSQKVLTTDEFCIDHTNQDANLVTGTVIACDDLVAVKEAPELKNEKIRRFRIYSIALLVSAVFLAMTLAIGFLIPSNHHVLHCRCQTYYVGCLLVGYVLLAINQSYGSLITGLPCSALATSMHFFFLAAFFWLNAMAFNIYWTFRDFRPTTLGKKQEKIRLRIYKIYAWGFPLLITIIAAIMDNIPDAQHLLRPRFGEITCWFFGDMEMFIYFFLPIGLLLCVNICFFASTTRSLMCGLWKQDDVKSSTERAALGRVCMKLVIIMGVTWVADVFSWAHSVLEKNSNASTIEHDVNYYFWYTMDAINALQGVLIFIVVATQPQVLSALARLFTPKTSRSKLNTTHGQHHSSSSNGLASIGDTMANNTLNSKIPMETIC